MITPPRRLPSCSILILPGTTRYFDDPDRPQPAREDQVGRLKVTSGPQPIILVPQPSEDPNDPLNWPLWRRDTILIVLSIVSVFAQSLGPILAANTLTMSLWYVRPFTEVALLTGWFLCGAGVAAFFFVAFARVWGKRHLFLLGVVILICSSAWAGASGTNYKSMLWARIIQGIGAAPYETLLNATVGDLYFVHERGKRMALTNLAVFGGAFFTPVLVGLITHRLGWEWTFYFEAIFCAACLPAIFFLVPETSFRRSAHLDTDLQSDDTDNRERTSESMPLSNMEKSSLPTATIPSSEETLNVHQPTNEATSGTTSTKPERSYAKTLKPFSGWYTEPSISLFFKILFRPLPLFFHPAILWGCLIQGTMIGWTVFIGIILAAIFLGPPLFWGEVETGYAYVGAFAGAILGFLVAGAFADWSAKFMTRRNGGIYEPEFRLVLVIPLLIFGCAGLYGFGVTSSKLYMYHWIWPIFFFGLEVMGMVIGAVASSLYIVDAHRDIAIEAFTCLIIFKNFLSFGLTFSAYNWILKYGIWETFRLISSLQVAICLLSIPMCELSLS